MPGAEDKGKTYETVPHCKKDVHEKDKQSKKKKKTKK